ncbi:MAG: AAA family ATPase [Anaerolineae bacterium]|nr:ATP-binding protein [Thermoplasmata archaeon]NIV32241.1 AAA family ATPase [Anaerolineae bacterium]NIY03693.1 AAA family ATPase [Thermoplasmata archaeon]
MSLKRFLKEGGSRLSSQALLAKPPKPPLTVEAAAGPQLREAFGREEIDYFISKLNQKDPNELPSRWAMLKQMTADFLGHEAMDSCIVRREWTPFWQPMLCLGFWQVSSHYEDVEVGPDKKVHTASTANIYLHTKCKKRIPMHVSANLRGDMFSDPSISVEIHRDHKEVAEAFLQDVDTWIRDANIYKDKLLTFTGGRGGRLSFLQVPPCSWDDVILPGKIIKQIRRATVDMLKRRDTFYDVGLGVRRSILLDGPPGVGKTQTNRALSNEVYATAETQATIIWVSTKSIESAKDVKGLYSAARTCAPTLLLLEDVDLIGASRGYSRDNYLLGELLTQMDGAEDNRGLITVATTNDLAKIDYALTKRPGRFDRVMPIPLPSAEAREVMLKRFATARKASFAKDCREADESTGMTKWAQILEATEGMTGAYLQELVNTAVIEAVNNDQVKNGRPILKAGDLLEALELINESFNASPRDLQTNKLLKTDGPYGTDSELVEKAAEVRQRLAQAMFATPADGGK